MIVRLYETFEDEKNLYLVQEYLPTDLVFVKEESYSVDYSHMVISVRLTLENFSLK